MSLLPTHRNPPQQPTCVAPLRVPRFARCGRQAGQRPPVVALELAHALRQSATDNAVETVNI